MTFEEVMPDRVCRVAYVSYSVRPFEKAPLRCYRCQQFGHVAAVCRGNRLCGRCGKDCNSECKEERANCFYCGGEQHAGAAKCPKTIKESKIYSLRKEWGMSYSDAVKKVDGQKEIGGEVERREEEEIRKVLENKICMEKTSFLAFIAMVINCAVELKRKSERIKMVLEAAKRFLDVEDVTAEELDSVLREGFAVTLAPGQE